MDAALKNFYLSFSWNTPLLLLFAVLALGLSIYIYRRTNPRVSTFLRIVLTSLRALALLILLFVIYEATLHFRYDKTNPPVLAVAVDNTASMTITDGEGSRAEILADILSREIWQQLADEFEIKYYTFTSRVEQFSPLTGDSLRFLGDATDIRQSLEKIKAENVTENLTNILLISDGNYNAGGNPVRFADELGVPIHTIGIGSSDLVKDMAVTEVDANPFAYTDQSTPIQITIRNSGFDRMSIPVVLQQGESVIARENVEIPASPSETSVTLDFTPTEIGRQKLDVVIPRQSEERLLENNTKSIYIDVFKSKLKILLIAGAVSPDIAFLKKNVQNERYQLSSLVHKRNGQFYEPLPSPDELSDVDIFILLDFPIAQTNPAFLQNLVESIERNKQPILLISGPNMSIRDLSRFGEVLPITSASQVRGDRQVSVEPSPLGANHPIMQVADDAATSQTIWRDVPPVFAPFVIRELAPDAQVLAYARPERGAVENLSPLITIRTNGAKSAAIFASQLWRWDFMMLGFDRSHGVYRNLLQNMLRWLETNRSESLVRVNMDKTQYKFGDPLDMVIEVYDENLNPVDNANVRISLVRRGEAQEFVAQPQGDGGYNAMLQAPQPGDYEATVTAEVDGQQIGKQTTLFSVGEYSAELTDIQAQPAVLQSLAQATGGLYVPADSTGQLITRISGEKTVTPMTMERELWNNQVVLFLVLFLLAVEWFLRKRWGMV